MEDEGNDPPGETTATLPPTPHAGLCPEGHEVPSWRETCGVCGQPAEPVTGQVEDAPAVDGSPRRPSPVAWVALGLLVVGALAFGLTRDEVLLEDDFSTPDVLRTWPYDDPSFDYDDGAYRVTSAADGPAQAFRELPRTVDGLSLSVALRAGAVGRPLAVIDCVTDATVDDETGVVLNQTGYSFLVSPDESYYGIIAGDELLDEGTLTGTTSEVTVGCESDGTTTTLRIQGAGGDPVEVEHADGATFMGVGLGVFAPKAGAQIVYDDLRVTGVG